MNIHFQKNEFTIYYKYNMELIRQQIEGIKKVYDKIINTIDICREKYLYNDKRIINYDFEEINTKTIALKANMGLGKTKELVNLCRKYEKIIIVTFRVSLGKEFIHKFEEFEFYQDIDKVIDLDLHPKIIVQIDSLSRIQGNCDLLVLDECQYNLIQLVQSNYREQSYNSLISYIKNTEYMIAIDALFNDDMIGYLYTLRNDLVYIENEYKFHNDKKVINHKNNIGIFEKTLFENLEKNKRICICTNSRNFLKNIEKKINSKFENKKCLYYDGVKDYILDLNDWNNADVVGYTPTITAGISYEKNNFDKIFGYFINTSSPAEMSIQQLFRVRNLKDNEINLCIDVKGENKYPIDKKTIEECIIKKHTKLAIYSSSIKIDNYHKDIVRDDYFNLYINYIKIINKSKNNYEDILLNLLKSQGLNIINKNINKEEMILNKKSRKENNEIKKEREINDDTDICNSDDIDEETFKRLNRSYKTNYKEKCQIKKYIYKKNYNIDNFTREEYSEYKKLFSVYNNVSLFYNYIDDIDDILKDKIMFKMEKNSNNNIKILHYKHIYEKMFILNKIIKNIGFDSLFDNKEIDLNYEKTRMFLKDNFNDIKLIWDLQKDITSIENDKDLLRFINDKLNTLFKIKININKETKKYYINGLEIWNDKYSYKNEYKINQIKEKHENEKKDYTIYKYLYDILNDIN